MALLDPSDIGLTAEQLDTKYNPYGYGEHPVLKRDAWKADVAEDDTLLSYWQWVAVEIDTNHDRWFEGQQPMHFAPREVATLLAALRYWQLRLMGEAPDDDFDDIASDGGRLAPLAAEDVDVLCDRINFGS